MIAAVGSIDHYVEALRTSSDRSRYALYVLIVATILIFIATHNIQRDSWPLRRLDAWYRYARRDTKTDPQPREIANGDPMRLEDVRSEYIKQYAARAVLTTTPLPGVSIDVNDVGLVGGLTLLSLSIVLLACVAREHENLYLSLFKVRALADAEGEDSQAGDSSANLLYHALAMTQVLNAPPTLARWDRWRCAAALRGIFVAPAIVYWWVVNDDWAHQQITRAYGVTAPERILGEGVVALVIFCVCLVTWFNSSAMGERWESAFFRVNPSRRASQQMSVLMWLRLTPRAKSATDRQRRRLSSALIDTLRISAPDITGSIEAAPVVLRLRRDRVTRRHVQAAIRRIEASRPPTLVSGVALRFVITSNIVARHRWVVLGRWVGEADTVIAQVRPN